MEYEELGRSGIKVSVIGLGTWQWGSREWGWGQSYGKKDVIDACEKAVEVGINFIDTAEVYGRGRSEEIIGEAIRGRREDFVIATKVSPLNVSYGGVLKAADRSLRRLGVDLIDLYQIHWPNPLVPIRSTMKAMKKLVQDGKVRCVGVSNFNLKRMKAAQEALAPLDLTSNQVKYNLLDRRIETDLLPYAKSERISIIAYSPLAQALLACKYTTSEMPTAFIQKINSRFSPRNLTCLAETNRVLSEIAKAHDRTAAQIALNWLIKNDRVIAIPGVKRPDHVIDNAGASNWRLTHLEIERLEAAVSRIRFDRLSSIPNVLKALTRQ